MSPTHVISYILALDVAYGEISDYNLRATNTYAMEVQMAGLSTVLHSQADVALPEGASTLYLVEQGGGLTLLNGLDTAVQWQRTDQASVTWTVDGFEPQTEIKLLMVEMQVRRTRVRWSPPHR